MVKEGIVMSKNLIVYYSRKGENYWLGGVKNLIKGNTETAAEFIQKAVGGDLFEVDTVKPYAEDYHICTDEAKKELNADIRPEIKRFLDSIDEYDTIFVGFPNWWGTMPMAMFTFLEHYDFSGKKIAPFCTNEGSGMGNSERDLAKICKGAEIVRGLPITGHQTKNSEAKISEWAKKQIK
jgi:flavodoxin